MAAIILAAFVISPFRMLAQTPEVTLSYGGYNQMDACDNHDGWGNVNTSWGSLNAGLNFVVNDRVSAGPTYTYSTTTTRGGTMRSSISYHTIMMNVNYIYSQKKRLTVYSHAGLGVLITHLMPDVTSPFNKTYCGVQISPLAAKLDLGNGFSAYGELGFGVQGVVQVGFTYRL